MRRGLAGLVVVLLFLPVAVVRGENPAAKPRASAFPQTLSVSASPGVALPLGPDAALFTAGAQLGLAAELGLKNEPLVFVGGSLRYTLQPIQAEQALSLLDLAVSSGVFLELAPRLDLKARGSAGLYLGLLNEDGSGVESRVLPSLGAGVDLELLVYPSLSLGIGVGYQTYLGLYQTLDIHAGTAYYIKGRQARSARLDSSRSYLPEYLQGARKPGKGEGLTVEGAQLQAVFPVFHKYYDDHAIGSVTIRNQGQKPVSDAKVSFFLKQYMDAPKACNEPVAIEPGESLEVPVVALFADRVLHVTEPTKAAAEILLEYRIDGEWYSDSRSESVRILDRNAMIWDDTRKVAAFVTARDPMILGLSKFVAGVVDAEGNPGVNPNLLTAMAIHEALRLYKLRYVVDPKSSYVELSKSQNQPDYVQFPRQTLEYRSGDCDDLAILYCAMLEAVGVETAFITIPGHIYMAFSTGLSAKAAQTALLDSRELVVAEGRAWIPVEVTEREGDFLAAWKTGARQWREQSATKQAELYPVRVAWQTYEPVASPGEERSIDSPAEEALSSSLGGVTLRFREEQILPRIAQAEAEARKAGATQAARNRLGVLYAQFGYADKAMDLFKQVIAQKEYVPSLINLANLFYLREDWVGALKLYERAAKLEPKNAIAVLGVARTNFGLENFGVVKKHYDTIQSLDPALARQFAYLGAQDATARADAAQSVREVVVWQE